MQTSEVQRPQAAAGAVAHPAVVSTPLFGGEQPPAWASGHGFMVATEVGVGG